MRNITIVSIIAMWLFSLSLSATDAISVNTISEDMTQIVFTLPEYEFETVVEDGLDFLRINIEASTHLSETGFPELPVFSTVIAVPVNSVVNVENQVESRKSTVENVKIYPTQNFQRAERTFDYEPAFYQTRNSESVYPEVSYAVSEVKTIRDYQVVVVNIYPMRYYPNREELEVTSEVRIDISHQGSDVRFSSDRKISRAFEPIYESLIANYHQVRVPNPVYQEPSLLIIYGGNPAGNTATNNNLNSLITWKRQRGFDVTAVRAAAIASPVSFNNIKAYIQTAYDTWENPPEYVMLIGGARANSGYPLPTLVANPGNIPPPSNSVADGPGDYPYTFLAGDDDLGDVFIGRLSVDDNNDFNAMIEKILHYERFPLEVGNDTYLGKTYLVSDASQSGISTFIVNRYIKSLILDYDPTHNVNMLLSTTQPGADLMINELNSGYTMFNHRGIENIAANFNDRINNLRNTNRLTHCVWITCGTGRFDGHTSAPTVEEIERVTRLTYNGDPAGGITAIGMSTTATHTAYNNALDGALFYGLYPADMATMGQAMLFSKLYLSSVYFGAGAGGAASSNHYMNLMGDPSLYVYKKKPNRFAVDLPAAAPLIIPIGTQGLRLEIIDEQGTPVSDAWVTLSIVTSNEVSYISKAFTESDGIAILNIDPSVSGLFLVWISKPGFVPQRGFVQVGSDASITVVDYAINETTGNDDGEINPGETIELSIEVRNYFDTAKSYLTATLTSDSQFITISRDTLNISSIDADTTALYTNAFTFTVSPFIPHNTLLPLTITIADSTTSWTSHLLPPVKAAYIDILGMTTSNGLDYLTLGTPVSFYYDFVNTGSYTAYDISAKFVPKSPYITTIDSIAFIGTMTAGAEASNHSDMFTIVLDSSIIPGITLLAELHIYSGENHIKVAPISLPAGNKLVTDPTGPCEYGYVIFDQDDTYENAPDYEWIDIKHPDNNTGMIDNWALGEEASILVQLDFPVWFYGVEYNEITICSNGWFAFGQTDQKDFRNLPLPGPVAPKAMVAPYWTDLAFGPARGSGDNAFPGGGGVYTYYDEIESKFIIQWDQVRLITRYNYGDKWTVGDSVSFQAIIYNHLYHPSTLGGSPIKFQYRRFLPGVPGDIIHPMNHITIGFQDHTEKRGLTYVYDNVYTPGSAPLSDGSALWIRTWEGATSYPDPILTVTPFSKAFPSTEIFTTATQTFTLGNRGIADLVIDSLYIEGSEDFTLSDITLPIVLGQGAEYYFTVSFTPTTFPTQTATITMINNSIHPTRTIALSGSAFEYINPPRNLRARVEEYYVQLDWDPPIDQDDANPTRAFLGYQIRRGTLILVELTTERTYRDIIGNISQQAIYNYSVYSVYETGVSTALSISNIVVYPVINITQFPWGEGFESTVTPTGWRNLSIDGDLRFWQRLTGAANVHSGTGAAASTSTVSGTTALPPDNWLITPKLNLPQSAGTSINLQYYVATHISGGIIHPEYYSIMLNNDGIAIENFIEIYYEAMDGGPTWFERNVDLTDYAGQNVYLAFRHHNINNGTGYSFLKIDDILVTVGGFVSDEEPLLPTVTSLRGNYPNPFNPSTTIEFGILNEDFRTNNVSIDIYNIKGQKVRSLVNRVYNSGIHRAVWNGKDDEGRDVSSGIYFYRMQVDELIQTKRMLLLK